MDEWLELSLSATHTNIVCKPTLSLTLTVEHYRGSLSSCVSGSACDITCCWVLLEKRTAFYQPPQPLAGSASRLFLLYYLHYLHHSLCQPLPELI